MGEKLKNKRGGKGREKTKFGRCFQSGTLLSVMRTKRRFTTREDLRKHARDKGQGSINEKTIEKKRERGGKSRARVSAFKQRGGGGDCQKKAVVRKPK